MTSFIHTRWVTASQHRHAAGNYASGAFAWTQQIGGPETLIKDMTANSEAMLAKALTHTIAAALIEYELEIGTPMLFVVPHLMTIYLEQHLPLWERTGNWARPDGDIWHQFYIHWQMIKGQLVKPRDEADVAELARLHELALKAAKKAA